MKWVLSILGALLFFFGVIWVLQGTNVLTAGFMAGHMQFTFL
jgi:hypothetical protein